MRESAFPTPPSARPTTSPRCWTPPSGAGRSICPPPYSWAHRNGRALGPKRIGLLVSVVYFATARYFFPPRDYRERDVAHAARQLRLPAAEQFEPDRYAADAATG